MSRSLDDFLAARPEEFDGALLALWWDGKGDFEKAHQIAQDVDGADGATVHAYLHRKEGDVGNASYWYRRAGREVARGDSQTEWQRLVEEMLRHE